MRKSNALSKILSIFVVTSMILSGMSLPWTGVTQEAYAKERGKKNQQACKECEAVQAGTAPAGYTDVLGNQAVYRGGTARSGLQNGTSLDSDPDTFASPLPYGDTYVDVDMIRWTETSTYIIDIPEKSPFHWVATSAAGASLRDANGREPETDPMGQKKGISKWVGQEKRNTAIAYVGPLKGFHDNFTDAASETGNTNEIKASDYNVPYLYKIVYPEAVTLPSGVRGNLVIIVDHVDIETTFTVDENHPRTLKADDGSFYTYTEAIVAVQNGNSMAASTAIIDGEGNYITQNNGVVKTADEVRAQLEGKVGNADLDASSQNKMPRGATGVHVDIEIQVTDVDGNEVEGTISYSAYDLDLMSYQNVWGRKSTGDDRLEFSEGLQIVSGSQSYALVPEYEHSAGTTLNTGWVPVGPNDNPLSSPLNISGGGGSHADGANFRAIGIVNYRDKDGRWDNALFNVSKNANDEQTMITFPNGVPWNENGQLTAPYTSMSPKWQVYAQLGLPSTATGADVFSLLGDASWATERADDNTFDTGFAVLLDAKSSKLRWSGSASSQGTVVTTLFDTTLFTYIEQTHGTGGGIYLESYKINDECKPVAKEGVVTMGKGATATVTAVPEEGYRVKRFLLGGTGLSNPVEYTIEDLGLTPGVAGQKVITAYAYDGVYYEEQSDAEAAAVADEHTAADVTEQHITFEMNADGTVDVSFDSVTDPRHVHVDFAADYYFYKVWKTPKDSSVDIPETLKLTATPFVFEMTSVTVREVIYKISNEGTTYTANGKTYHMTANSTIVLGEGDDAKTYTLVGDKLVDSGGNEYQISTSTEQGNPKTFTISSTGSDVSDGFVKVETDSDGNTVWKVKYPEEGREATSGTWPALPIETYEGSEHNYNHVQRNYWFVTETVPPAWTESYDNSTALAPGIVKAEDGEGTLWKEMATIYHSSAEKLIASKDDEKFAFLSPLSENVTHNGTTYTGWGGEITNEITPPEGTPKETYGAKNEPQYADGKSMFTVTTDKAQDGTDNEIEKVELIGPDGKPATSVKVNGGTYIIDQDGMITFTPDKDFVGDPPPVTVRGTDKNGLSAETTYTPHVRDVIKTVTRTIVYEYEDGTPVKDKDGNPLTVEQTVIFEGTINPDTGEIVYPSGSSGTMEEVPSDEINDYNVDRDTVGEAVVYPNSDDLFEKVIYSPKNIIPQADETYGLPNKPQTGSPSFEMEMPTLPDETPNELTIKLIDPKTGKETDSTTVSAVDKDGNVVGTYTLNDNGTTTFTPNDGYVGNPQPLELVGKDKLDNVAKTTYTPHIVDPVDQDTATRTIHYTYLTNDGKKVTGDTTQTAVLHRHAKSVDPKTGEVLEWDDWEPATFPAVKNPDDKVNGKIWFTDDSAGEQTVTKPGRAPDVHIVYQKVPYTVKYLNGLHGKSDGKGDETGVPYGDMVKGGNTVTPNSGYKFTGKYTYVIRDRDGNIIKTGETDDPTSVEVIGNVEFTPIYKKLPTVIYVDPATGRIIQKTLPFLDENTEPDPPADPTREGYKFIGWDRIEEYDENGELVNVRYEAKWEKIEEPKIEPTDTNEDPPETTVAPTEDASDSSGNPTTRKGVKTGDDTFILMDIAVLLSSGLAIFLMIRRRRKYNR